MADVKQLLDGYRHFYRRHFIHGDARISELAEQGQSPKTLVIACSDSRVDPAIIMDVDPGDIFVIRNVANLVPPCEEGKEGYHGTSAALEFAVRHLHVEHIIVFGHSGCAGIQALLHAAPEQEKLSFIAPWMDIAAKAKEATYQLCGDVHHPDAGLICEQQGILVSLQNLQTFAWIEERIAQGTLTLHGWYFRLTTGQLLVWSAQDQRFVTVETA